ncbi:MAG TPA: D-amino-acid transaminase [Hyphomonadaceae bacterium]|nr:D-amino-acid transaminase [Hyphomonadaceae bacterium]HPI49775.1 D-amino-acid transaminase [Hyphomonadaceae bacterium]
MTRQAWVNGVYVAADEAKISPFDRGFLFADGVYEVTAVYAGRTVDMERHLDRLERSLRELKFGAMPDRKELEEVHRRLVADNGITEGYVYLQVTRGAYGSRDFVAPDKPTLTCFAYAESRALIDTPSARNGIRVISVPDIRWARRDIKSVGLLAQALAKTEAKARGADDAWLVAPDGFVTEGASSNAWIVTQDGEIITRALSNMILAGITRHALFDSLGQQGRKITERSFTLEEAKNAAEAFVTAATGLVTPVTEIDGVKIGAGKPGSATRNIQKLYYTAIGADVSKAAPWVSE